MPYTPFPSCLLHQPFRPAYPPQNPFLLWQNAKSHKQGLHGDDHSSFRVLLLLPFTIIPTAELTMCQAIPSSISSLNSLRPWQNSMFHRQDLCDLCQKKTTMKTLSYNNSEKKNPFLLFYFENKGTPSLTLMPAAAICAINMQHC